VARKNGRQTLPTSTSATFRSGRFGCSSTGRLAKAGSTSTRIANAAGSQWPSQRKAQASGAGTHLSTMQPFGSGPESTGPDPLGHAYDFDRDRDRDVDRDFDFGFDTGFRCSDFTSSSTSGRIRVPCTVRAASVS
jgi:hypothetical protein